MTTIELRKVIVAESHAPDENCQCRLEGNFARITGALGDYGIHLGSGKGRSGLLWLALSMLS